MRKTGASLFFFLLLAIPGIAFAAVLTSGGGFRWDFDQTTSGAVATGTSGAYNGTGAFELYVGGFRYNAGGMSASVSPDGRTYTTANILNPIAMVNVQRVIYVPDAGADYIRYLDVLTNPGATDRMVMVRVTSNAGSDTMTVVANSSSGDTTVSAADEWFVTDDADMAGDPSLGWVIQGAGGSLAAATASVGGAGGDVVEWTYTVTVPAGGRAAILYYGIQANSRAAAEAEATRLAGTPADALAGLDAYLDDIVNFDAGLGSAPVVTFLGPEEAEEQAEVTLNVMVTDPDGDAVTWSWDTDNDGTFGEAPNMGSVTIPAGTTDGPATMRFGVEAMDAIGRISTSYHTIRIVNVAPTITSEAPTQTSIRMEYQYQIEAADVAGDLDPLAYRLMEAPSGMAVSSSGLVTWRAPALAVDRIFSIEVAVLDGDGGDTRQGWSLLVVENTTPTQPTPVSPIDRVYVSPTDTVTLVVDNAVDADGDELFYFFRIDRSSSFTSPDIIRSPAVPEGASGQTMFTTSEPLGAGLWYWQAWVDDGDAVSTGRFGQFIVGVPPEDRDAGPPPTPDAGTRQDSGTTPPPPPPDNGGCSVSAGGLAAGDQSTKSAGSLALFLGLLGLSLIRRRRR